MKLTLLFNLLLFKCSNQDILEVDNELCIRTLNDKGETLNLMINSELMTTDFSITISRFVLR